jgi:hypothetical protein
MQRTPFFMLAALIACLFSLPCQAEERSAEDWLTIALQQGVESLSKRDENSVLDVMYEFPELSYRLVIYDAKLGNKDRAKDTLKLLALTTAWIIESEDEDDPWPRTYLPGPAYAVEHKLDIPIPDDALNKAFEEQIFAETYFVLGEKEKYQQACDKTFALLEKAEQIDIKLAQEGEYPYTGGYLSWHSARMCRDHNDLDNSRKFAGYDWHDPCEKAGLLSIQAQMEWVAGNKDAALKLTTQATTLMKKAVERSWKERNALQRAVPADELWAVIYYPELNNHLPELYAAIYLATGEEEAEKIAGLLAFEDTLWQSPAYVHTATNLRRAGEEEKAFAMVKKGMDVLMAADELPSTYDTMHLSRELAMQGKDDLVQKLYDKHDNQVFKSFVAIGVVQAKMAK